MWSLTQPAYCSQAKCIPPTRKTATGLRSSSPLFTTPLRSCATSSPIAPTRATSYSN